jgi:uncharacterized protein YyaL (SSP411 family)
VANRLARETSPYLLQHAENPVDWYAWSDEAFARARDEDKPILLSVGYAACHWCHVMEHESFEDAETAWLMNEHFVSVKVDREERPDVDGLYMEAVVALTGHGGWPMTVFLTPEGKPFWGGTYFPPEPRYDMPSFRQVLASIAETWSGRRGDVGRQAELLTQAIREGSERAPSTDPLTTGLLNNAVSTLAREFDSERGGFGRAPKFPPASVLEFLLRIHSGRGSEPALEMTRATLDAMAAGGMYDLVGGGFHRYSVDADWLVPHFEKMLYDNALLATAYLHAWQVTGEGRYRRVVEETLDYLLRDLRVPEGGLASAEDADTEGVEGRTYTWTGEELAAALGEEHPDWLRPFEHGRDILRAELAEDERRRLFIVRERRPKPGRDDKVVAAWNGLALAALAESGRVLGRADYIEAAQALAGFLVETMTREDGTLLRTYRRGEAKIEGYLEDHADVANGLIELYWATGAVEHLETARRLADRAHERFHDPERGGYFVDAHGLVARRKEFDDHPTPSGNSMIAFVLLRLARIYGDAELERRAVEIFRLARSILEHAPAAAGHLLCALDLHFSRPREIAIVGDSEELRETAMAAFQPSTVFALARGPDDPAAARVPLLAGKGLVDGKPAVYVCESFACRAPVTTPDELRAALSAAAG